MGRRDLSHERRNQILDAFAQCIVQHGLASTTVTKVAEAAGMKRSIIHHYIGDRNDLLAALLQRYIEEDQQLLAAYLARQTTQLDIDQLVDYLFSDWAQSEPQSVVILNALLAETAHNPDLRALCLAAYENVERGIAQIVHRHVPAATQEQCDNVALALLSMVNGSFVMVGLGYDAARLSALKVLAKRFVFQLDN